MKLVESSTQTGIDLTNTLLHTLTVNDDNRYYARVFLDNTAGGGLSYYFLETIQRLGVGSVYSQMGSGEYLPTAETSSFWVFLDLGVLMSGDVVLLTVLNNGSTSANVITEIWADDKPAPQSFGVIIQNANH